MTDDHQPNEGLLRSIDAPEVSRRDLLKTTGLALAGNALLSSELSRAQTVIDGFESGSYDDGEPVTWQVESPGEYVNVQSSLMKNGEYALEMKSGQANENHAVLFHRADSSTIHDGDVFSVWMRTDGRAFYSLNSQVERGGGPHSIKAGVVTDHDNLQILTHDKNGNQIAKQKFGSADAGKWYLFEMEMYPSQSELVGRVYDSTKEIIGEETLSTSGETSLEYTILHVPTPFGRQDRGWFDDVSIHARSQVEAKSVGSGGQEDMDNEEIDDTDVLSDWPQFGFDSANSGYNPEAIVPSEDIHRRWTFDTGDRTLPRTVGGPPAVVDGTVFVGVETILYAIDSETGKKRWQFDSDGAVTSPAVTDNSVFAGAGSLYSVDVDTGKPNWRFKTDGSVSSPTIVNGTVFVGAASLYAVDAKTGEERWRFETNNTLSRPAVAKDTVLIRNFTDLVSVDAKTGEEQWRFDSGEVSSQPVAADSTVFVGSHRHTVHAVDINTGEKLWQASSGGGWSSSGVRRLSVADGTVYAAYLNINRLDTFEGAYRREIRRSATAINKLKSRLDETEFSLPDTELNLAKAQTAFQNGEYNQAIQLAEQANSTFDREFAAAEEAQSQLDELENSGIGPVANFLGKDDLIGQAEQAFESGDYQRANQLLQKAQQKEDLAYWITGGGILGTGLLGYGSLKGAKQIKKRQEYVRERRDAEHELNEAKRSIESAGIDEEDVQTLDEFSHIPPICDIEAMISNGNYSTAQRYAEDIQNNVQSLKNETRDTVNQIEETIDFRQGKVTELLGQAQATLSSGNYIQAREFAEQVEEAQQALKAIDQAETALEEYTELKNELRDILSLSGLSSINQNLLKNAKQELDSYHFKEAEEDAEKSREKVQNQRDELKTRVEERINKASDSVEREIEHATDVVDSDEETLRSEKFDTSTNLLNDSWSAVQNQELEKALSTASEAVSKAEEIRRDIELEAAQDTLNQAKSKADAVEDLDIKGQDKLREADAAYANGDHARAQQLAIQAEKALIAEERLGQVRELTEFLTSLFAVDDTGDIFATDHEQLSEEEHVSLEDADTTESTPRLEQLAQEGATALQRDEYDDAVDRAEQALTYAQQGVEWLAGEEVKQAERTIQADKPGADITTARDRLESAREAKERGNDREALRFAREAQLAAEPTFDYLLDDAKKHVREARTAFEQEAYDESIAAWEDALDVYGQAEDLAEARDDEEMFKSVQDSIERVEQNLENTRRQQANARLVAFGDEANDAMDQGNDLFDDGDFVEAREEFVRARDAFQDAIDIAREQGFDDLDQLEQGYEQAVESITDCLLAKGDQRLGAAYETLEDGASDDAVDQFQDTIAYLEDLDVERAEREQLLEDARRGHIHADTKVGRQLMHQAEELYDDGELYEAKERFTDARDHLRGVHDQAVAYNIADERQAINELIDACIDNTRQNTEELTEVAEVDTSLQRLGELHSSRTAYTPSDREPRIPRMTVEDRLQEQLPAHEVLEWIGSGGNANVHKVRLEDTGTVAALKVPHWQGTLSAEVREEFIDEAETWEQIDAHTNIVSVLNWGTIPYPWLLLEHLDRSLREQLAEPLPLDRKLEILTAVADALKYAHGHSVIHLDIKPENILLDGEGTPKVADWGLAEIMLNYTQMTGLELTPGYAAPEQLTEEAGTVDWQTDVYQLGVLAYEVLTGQVPFATDRPEDYRRMVLEETPKPPSEQTDKLPPELDEAVLRSLARDRGERYEAVIQFRDALRDILHTVRGEDV